jgi:teichuronic acid biosynthesis protein TuaE
MVLSLKRIIRFILFVLPLIIMLGSYAVLFKISGIGYINIERLIFYFTILLILIYLIRFKHITINMGESFKYVLVFIIMLLYSTISLLWVENISYSYSNGYMYLFAGVSIIVFMTACISNLNDIAIFLRVFTICYSITVIFGIFEIFTGIYIFTQNPASLLYKNGYDLFYPYTTFYNMNDYATFVVMTIPFMVFQIISDFKGTLGKIIAAVLSVAGLFTVFNANARICYFTIALFVVAFITAMAAKKDLRQYLKPVFRYTAVFILIFITLLITSFVKLNVFGTELSSISLNDHSITERGELFSAGLKMLSDYNFMGVGEGNSVPLVPKYSSLQPINLHSMPLRFLTEYGIIIFALYLLMLVSVAIKLFKYNAGGTREKVLASICFASLISFQLADFASSDASRITELWIIMALWLCVLKLINQKKNQEHVGNALCGVPLINKNVKGRMDI